MQLNYERIDNVIIIYLKGHLDIYITGLIEKEIINKLSYKSHKRGIKAKPDYKKIADEFYNRIVELTERLNSLDY